MSGCRIKQAYVIETLEPTIGLELEALAGVRGAAERETAAEIASAARELYKQICPIGKKWSRRSDLNR